MKFFKYLFLLLLILVIGFSIYIAVQPNSFKVTRTKTMNAPREVVYNNVIDFKNWESWSSWKEERPETIITLSEQTEGIGGSYSWEDEDGVGTMTTINAKAYDSIQQEMQFGDFPKSDVSWNFKKNEDNTTDVTWIIEGNDLPFTFKFFTTLMGGMEAQIGPHFERGLTKLDSVLQVNMKAYTISVNGETYHSGGYYIYNTTSCKFSEFNSKMQSMLPKVGAYAITNNITMAGKPFILYHKWDEDNDAVIFSCCIPTNSKITTTNPEILTGQLESFKCVKTTLKGNYTNLKEAWGTTMTYIVKNNLKAIERGNMLETYVTDPTSTPNPANWVTEIYIAVE